MVAFKVAVGILAVLIGLSSYIPYFHDLFAGKTKPHAFSWLIWSILSGLAFAAQIVERGGVGAGVTGISALACLIIFIFAWHRGNHDFPKVDWFFLLMAFVALLLWGYTKDPTASVILITLTDTLAFLPTFRKSYFRPYQETISTYALSSLKWLLGFWALENFTVATALYPLSGVITNCLFVTLVLVRRRQVK